MTLAKNIFSILIFSAVTSLVCGQDITINEVIYSNKTILTDSHGNTPDWIELFNSSNKTINLANYQITDDTTETDYWTFPDYELESGGFLILYASGEDTVLSNEFHLDFKLSMMQDNVYLIGPTGAITDWVEVECAPSDKSLSSKPDGSQNRVVTEPTPGTSNNDAAEIEINFLSDLLEAETASGFYENPIDLVLKHKHASNTIRYTLDAEDPDEDSPIYNSPINLKDLTPEENRFANIPETVIEPGNKIFKANVVRARVFSEGCPASNSINGIYFINPDIKEKYNVPIVSIITDQDNLFDDDIGIYVLGNHNNYSQRGKAWEREVHVSMFDADKDMIVDQDAGMRISGKGSRSGPQKPLRLYARDEYGKEFFEYPFFKQKPEIDRYRTLLLRSTRGLSGTIFKDELTQSLVQDMNLDFSGFQPVIAFINGEYWGIYSLRERLDEGYIEQNYNIKDPQPDIISHDLTRYVLENGTIDSYEFLRNFLDNCDPESETFYDEIKELVDIPELIDYYVAENYFANYDFPHNNLKMWKLNDPETPWRFYFFDCDACMINIKQDQLSEYSSDIEDFNVHEEYATVLMDKLLQNQGFQDDFANASHKHLQTTFSPDKVLEAINNFEELYAPLVGEHTYRWHQPTDYVKWLNNVEMMRVFAIQRPLVYMEQIQDNFSDAFTISPNPSKGDFSIHLLSDLFEDCTVEIITTTGSIVYKQVFSGATGSSIDINKSLKSGSYILRLTTTYYTNSEILIIQ